MKQIAKALYDFWSSFSIPAYPENNVPYSEDGVTPVEPPYITYRVTRPDWRTQVSTFARVWYKDTSYKDISDKVDEIESRIGEGVMLPTDNGFLLLFKDINFCQYEPTDDSRLKVAYLSLIEEANT